MNTAVKKFMLTKEQVDDIVARIAEECPQAERCTDSLEEMLLGVVDKPRLYARLCSAIGAYTATRLKHIRSDSRRTDEFYARHAQRFGIPPREEWWQDTARQ